MNELPVVVVGAGPIGLAAAAETCRWGDEFARVVTGFRTAAIESDGDEVALVSDAGQRIDGVDRVVVLTGFRPDLSWLSEIRLGLAPLIDPNVHSCGTVYPHGVKELSHPEPGVFLAGMKSYGRAPTFLAMTGYEQVRSIAAALAGDHESAARVELTLPETGVCGGAGVFDDPDEAASEDGCTAVSSPRLIALGGRAGSRGAQ